ncbi:MAG: acetylornithine transaminase [Marinobacterium sp.]|nr:acetylornithine transaminase [Marinobacterium sp.]
MSSSLPTMQNASPTQPYTSTDTTCTNTLSTDYLIPVAPRPEQIFVAGQGHTLIDQHGCHYLDMVQGWAVNTLGHSPVLIQQVLAEQSAKLLNPGPGFYNKPMLELAQLLCLHSGLDQAFFANSGAEANEGAIKLARKWGQKYRQGAFKIITFKDSFHGRTLATMSATGKAAFESLFEPKVSGFIHLPFNDLTAVEQAIDNQTVAIMLEPIQGEAGVIPAQQAFVKGLEQLCHQHNLLLIIDEVQTGIGRTGQLFAHQALGVNPHIMTLGKGLGGGVPISAMLIDSEISCFDYGDQGGTFNGNPLMCAVALAVVNAVLEKDFMANVKARGYELAHALQQLSQRHGLGEVRGQGLLLAINTGKHNAQKLAEQALAAGLLINAPRPDTLRFMPALNLGSQQIHQAVDCLDQLLAGECA